MTISMWWISDRRLISIILASLYLFVPASWAQKVEMGEERPVGEKTEAPWEQTTKRFPFSLQGELWNKFAYDITEDTKFEDDYSNHAEIKLETKYIPNQTFQAVLGIEADYFIFGNDGDWDQEGDIRLYNAYLNFAASHFNLRIGNQIVRWGKIVEVSPLDNLNPEDLRDGFVRPRTERKLPIPMVNVELFREAYKLQGIFIPFFREAELDFFGNNWALFDQVDKEDGPVVVQEEDPPKTLRNSEVGVRFSGTVRALDYAFSYLYAREDLPSFESLVIPTGFPSLLSSPTIKDLARFARATGQPIRLEHDRQSIFGIEFETVWGSVGLRGDIAYIYRESFLTRELQAIDKPVFQYVLGTDYNSPGGLYVNLRFSQSIIQDHDEEILFFDEITNQVSGEMSKEVLNNKLKLDFRFLYDITRDSFYLNPNVTLQHWQNISVELGTDLVGGPADTPIGLFRNNDQVYGILRIFF